MEVANRWGDADSIGGTAGNGDVTALSAMINGFYDFHLDGALTPYIGAGIGGAQIEVNGLSPVGTTSISDEDTVLAYQAMLGVAFSLNESVSLTADYRYFGASDLSYSAANNTSVDQDYANQSIMFGLRFNIGTGSSSMPEAGGAAPSMPETALVQKPAISVVTQPVQEASTDSGAEQIAAAPALPQFPRAYRILFDWNDAKLTGASLDVVRQAAENALHGGITRIEATGHADTSGAQAFNMNLSRKRAEVVRQALLNLGITDEQIVVHWHGEAQPLVSTGDNVRELQNRRVEIIFAGEQIQ